MQHRIIKIIFLLVNDQCSDAVCWIEEQIFADWQQWPDAFFLSKHQISHRTPSHIWKCHHTARLKYSS